MADASNFWLKISDFNSIQCFIKLQNLTTRTTVKELPKSIIAEFGERELVVEIPARSCAQGHNLMGDIEIVPVGPERKWQFVFTATVKMIEGHGNPVERVTLSLVQFPEAEWERLQKVFNSRQDEIEDFLKSARGY